MSFTRFLETKSVKETLPAMQSIINEIHCHFKCKAVFRIHADRAKELTGEEIDDHFCRQGIRVTETPGYEPNANPRADSAVGVVKTRARIMLQSLADEGRPCWPLALQHACWRLRSGASRR